jgi:hypothetical protein
MLKLGAGLVGGVALATSLDVMSLSIPVMLFSGLTCREAALSPVPSLRP